MLIRLLAAFTFLAFPAWGQTMTLDLGRDVPWDGVPYAPLPLQVRMSDAPQGAWKDGAIVAWKDGWLDISGQITVVLDHTQAPPAPPNFTFRIFPTAVCGPVSLPGPGAALPLPSASATTNYVDGNPAHTRLHVTMH
jgi:hypothetical protein